MITYRWMDKECTKEQILQWIEWKKRELVVEEKLRWRGTNYYQGTLKDIKEAELLIENGGA